MASSLPLEGVRVVDTTIELGEMGGRLLADLGAHVSRIEPPGGGPSRRVPPTSGGLGLFHAVRNLGKEVVELDLDSPAGRGRFEELLSEADIWLDSSPPGHPLATGLEPAALTRERPRLIAVSVTPFGLSGPYRDHAATEPVVAALSGLLFRAGVPELPPVLAPGAFAYDIAGIVAVFAALAAYWQRQSTGLGQPIDVSAMEASAQTTDWGLTTYSYISRIGTYAELRNGGGPAYNIYPCRDGYVRTSVVTRREWHKIRAWLGEPEFLQDPHWDNGANRIEARDVIEGLYRELFRDRTMAELCVEGQARGLGVTPLLAPADVLRAEHFSELGSFLPLEVGEGRVGLVPSGFFTFDDRRIGPRLGALEASGLPASRPDARPGGDRPFSGLRVLDFGVAGAAPEVARLLAEYGAEAIRVESRLRPDLFRVLMGMETSPTFAASNRSKQSFGVDFRSRRGLELIKDLVARSDVLVENLPPGTMAEIGLDWDVVHELNPRMVMFSSQLMGHRGPWRSWRGYGANAQPVAGLTHLWSYPGMPPVGANVAFPDHVVGRLGAAAVVAALIERERTGIGRHVRIAQVEVVLNFLADLYLLESLEPGSVGPRGNSSDIGCPWGVYQCAGEQRWCVITCRDDADWAGLVSAMGKPPWATDARLTEVRGRRLESERIDNLITEWTLGRSDGEVMEILQAHGVPAGRMSYISDYPADPHLLARGFIRTLEQPGLGELMFDGPAFVGPGLGMPVLTEAPALGQDTRRIATELLGLAVPTVDALIEADVLYEPL